MAHKTEVNIRIPDLDDLCCVNCQIDPVEMQDPIVKSLFHCQILTCRLIIYSVRCCIASPSIQNIGNLIHVIVSKKFYTTLTLQNHLTNLKIQFSDPEPVHPKIYEACLKYTITFKLAPTWNLVGKFSYLRGFNFLALPIGLDAMEWRILPKDGNTKLEMKPMRLNLSPLTLKFLSLSPCMIDDFKNNPDCTIDSIDLRLFETPWVYVLPNLSRAQLISVSKSLPENCPFQNYDDLRRHWKNMYSYRLPKTQQGMLFYEVALPGFPNQHFTYPEICILSRKPEILLCDKKNEITAEFLKDLTTSVHSICGERMRIGQTFPELKIEYSYTFKTRSKDCSSQRKDDYSSPFFKTPNNYVMKTSGDKLKLSSLFTFKGIDKMSSTMKNHTQQVYSIMASQSQPKPSKYEKSGCALPTSFHKSINPTKTKPSITFEKTPFSSNQEKTFLNNTVDIMSFYDIPSMYPNESENLKKSSKNESKSILGSQRELDSCDNFSTVREAFSRSSQPPNKPIIKSIENVNFNLTRFEDPKPGHGFPKPFSRNQNLSQVDKTFQNSESSQNSNIRKFKLLNDFEEDDEEFFPIYKTGMKSSKNLPSQFDYFRNSGTSISQRGSQAVDQNSQSKKTKNDPVKALLNSFNELKNVHKMKNKENTVEDEGARKFSFDSTVENPAGISSSQECNNKPYTEHAYSTGQFFGQESSQQYRMQLSNENETVSQYIKQNEITATSQLNPSDPRSFEKPKGISHHLAKLESKYLEEKFELSPIRTCSVPDPDTYINTSNHQMDKIESDEEDDDKFVEEILENNAKSDSKFCEFSSSTWKTTNKKRFGNTLGNTFMSGNGDSYSLQDSGRICERSSQNPTGDNVYNNSNSSQGFALNNAFTGNHREDNEKESQSSQKRNDFSVNSGERVNDQFVQPQLSEQKIDQGDFMSILSQSSSESDSGDYESYKLAFKEALTFNNLDESIKMSR